MQSVLNAHDQVANKDYPVQAIPVNERSGTTNQFEIVRIDKKRNPLVSEHCVVALLHDNIHCLLYHYHAGCHSEGGQSW